MKRVIPLLYMLEKLNFSVAHSCEGLVFTAVHSTEIQLIASEIENIR